jgi:peptidoglycan-N-acetylglucosamine deacetylase
MRLFRPCFLSALLYPAALFRVKTTEKVLYLTFDDGPYVSSTLPLLRILADYGIRAVFFCSGKAASENQELINTIKSAGHALGNHGFNHPDGLFASKEKYLRDIKAAIPFTSDNIFRPPYGRLRMSQYSELERSFQIIMWDLMPYDFDKSFGSEKSLSVLIKMIRPGSIIVLHDTPGSSVLEILPHFIEFAITKGYRFDLPPMKL